MINRRFLSMFLATVSLASLCGCAGDVEDSSAATGTSVSVNQTLPSQTQSQVPAQDPTQGTTTAAPDLEKPVHWSQNVNGDPFQIFDFSEAKDLYGDKTISVIGDSITQGLNSELFYDNSWVSIFKNVMAAKYGTGSIGFVSLQDRTNEAVPGRELHTITYTGKWSRYYAEGSLPGGLGYSSRAEGATMRVELNRKEGGVDRHINGFYVYYGSGPHRGNFTVKVNGEEVAQIDGYQQKLDGCTRSEYIALPENCPDEVVIEIVVGKSINKNVIIAGFSYIDDPNDIIVNNYSLSGIKLTDYNDDTLVKMCQANVVIMTLGTNDCGAGVTVENFRKKLDVIVNACKENGSVLIIGNMIWERDNAPENAEIYKTTLQNAVEGMEKGYYLDFNLAKVRDEGFLEASRPQDVHPTIVGHDLIAQVLCEFLEELNS